MLKVSASVPNAGVCNASAPGTPATGLNTSLGATAGAAGTPLTQAVPTAQDLQLCQFIQLNGSGFGICGQARTFLSGPSIVLPTSLSVNPGEQAAFPVKLSAPAPSGGVFIVLGVANPSVASLNTLNVFIPEGQTESNRVRLNGLAIGTATITATANGFPAASTQVQVGGGGVGPGQGGNPPTLILPSNITLNVGDQVVVPISLGGTVPADGVFLTLSVSNPAVASLNVMNVIIASGDTTSQRLRLNGLSVGSAMLTASAPGYATVSAPVQVR